MKDSNRELKGIKKRLITPSSELLSRFTSEAEKAGAKIHSSKDFNDAIIEIAEIAKKNNSSLGIDINEIISPELRKGLKEKGGLTIFDQDIENQKNKADLGILRGDAAIAETGTIIHLSYRADERSLATLTPIQIALIKEDSLLPTLEEAAPFLRSLINGSRDKIKPTFITMITGPSRTADIERTLTIGVHGPKELHIIFYK